MTKTFTLSAPLRQGAYTWFEREVPPDHALLLTVSDPSASGGTYAIAAVETPDRGVQAGDDPERGAHSAALAVHTSQGGTIRFGVRDLRWVGGREVTLSGALVPTPPSAPEAQRPTSLYDAQPLDQLPARVEAYAHPSSTQLDGEPALEGLDTSRASYRVAMTPQAELLVMTLPDWRNATPRAESFLVDTHDETRTQLIIPQELLVQRALSIHTRHDNVVSMEHPGRFSIAHLSVLTPGDLTLQIVTAQSTYDQLQQSVLPEQPFFSGPYQLHVSALP